MKRNIIFILSCLIGGVGLIAVPCIGLSFVSANATSNKMSFSDSLYSKYTNLSADLSQVFANNGTIQDANHTWAFVGGKASGTLDDLQAARNYIGDFEEDIRGIWTNLNVAHTQPQYNYFQRYVNDLTTPGMTLKDINTNWDRVEANNPESVAYLISDEDFLKTNSTSQVNLNDFLNQLIIFILKGLSLRNNNGFVFIQKHWATNNIVENSFIQKYNDLVDVAIEKINSINSDYLKRIVVINHYVTTNNNIDFLKNDFNSDNQLNQYGQFEIGKQFAQQTYGNVIVNGKLDNINWGALQTTSQYSNLWGGYSYKVELNKTLASEVYLLNNSSSSNSFYVNEINTTSPVSDFLTQNLPTVTSIADSSNSFVSIKVTLPIEVTATNFIYKLYLQSGYYIEGSATAYNNSFIISNLQPSKTFILKIFTTDGKQIPTIYGNTSQNTSSSVALTSQQQAFQTKIKSSNKLNWVVIGDSITQGIAWTKGYNSATQDFWKSLQQDFGRTNDTLTNLSISGNTTTEELKNMQYRVDQTQPDIVIISLGINDIAISQGANNSQEYINNISKIISHIRQLNPKTYFLINSIIPTTASNITTNIINTYNNALSQLVIQLTSNDSPIIFNSDLNTDFTNITNNRSYYYSHNFDYFYAQDCLHLSVDGSLFMALRWLQAIGFDVNDSRLNYESYISLTKQDATSVAPKAIPQASINTSTTRLTVNLSNIASLSDVYNVYTKVEDLNTGQIFNTTSPKNQSSVAFDLFGSVNDKLKITCYGYSKTSAVEWTFPTVELN